jgi:uncharacterized protein YvpB
MKRIHLLKQSALICLVISLVFTSSVFSYLLYDEWTQYAEAKANRENDTADRDPDSVPVKGTIDERTEPKAEAEALPTEVLLDAPLVKQYPELPRGCEITSLTMLLQYYGIDKDKLELAEEMRKDPTPIQWNEDGTIKYWGHPNLGFVGEITRKAIGFGIYHRALFETLEAYVPTAVDITGEDFKNIEAYLAEGSPVVAWTTINYTVPQEWVVWETSLGPIKTTFSEHSVLITGFDADYVYLNDPLKSEKNIKVSKDQFIASWKAMGKQALTYKAEL